MREKTIYAQVGERIPDTVEKIRRELLASARLVNEGDEILIRVIIGKEPALPKHCEKPPLGIVPRYIWEEKRRDELVKAMNRYTAAGCRVPPEWIAEYNALVEYLSGGGESGHVFS